MLSQEARQQNEVFFHAMEKRRPHFTLKLVQSLDGKIATKDRRFPPDHRQKGKGMGPTAQGRSQAIRVGAALCGQMTLSSTRGRAMKDDPIRIIVDTEAQGFLWRAADFRLKTYLL